MAEQSQRIKEMVGLRTARPEPKAVIKVNWMMKAPKIISRVGNLTSSKEASLF